MSLSKPPRMWQDNLKTATAAIRACERPPGKRLVISLLDLSGVTLYGITNPVCFDRCAPVGAFRLEG
jgi:hypothetical protein